jgi:uncharacterized protein YjhX (UPF0386 family)
MAQKWYNKASVQVAIVTSIGLIIATAITIWFQRSDLKNENKQLKKDYRKLEIRYDEAKTDRDKAEIRLAPFLAAAERHFKDVPESERLSSLYDKVDEMFVSLQTGDRVILGKLESIENKVGAMSEAQLMSGDRILHPDVKNRMINDLKKVSDWKVKITVTMGDGEAHVFAEQLKTIFEGAGWSVDGVSLAIFSKPVRKVILKVSEPPPGRIQQALMPLFDQFNNPREAFLDDKLPNNTISIVVGKK